MTGIDVPSAWERSAEAIERLGSATVLVIGGPDVGKTTYCRFVARRLRESAETKRRARERAFARYLRTGVALDDPRLLHAERTPEGVVAVAPEERSSSGDPHLLPAGFERNLLCGVADRRDEGLGLATIRHIDFGRRTVSLLTPVAPERIAVLQLGDLYVAPDGRELGGRSPVRP